MDELRLRRTVIGGETEPDDYVVIWDEIHIGRIHRQIGRPDVAWGCGSRESRSSPRTVVQGHRGSQADGQARLERHPPDPDG